MARTELTDVEQKHKKQIDPLVQQRADLERRLHQLNHDIANAAVAARGDAVSMARLAEWLQVVDFKRGNPDIGELRPITRQAVDQLVAKHENRERQPNRRQGQGARTRGAAAKPKTNGTPKNTGKINLAVFG
jgi:hypothetical protein